MGLFKNKGISELPEELIIKDAPKKPAVAGWRIKFYRLSRKFDLTCEHAEFRGSAPSLGRHYSPGNSGRIIL